ncbi:hypothetical protein N9B94_01685 [Verrucomicrobia bacterium]|nr:hypothetical protein [Verrucomicrobiota bacterium]
MNTLWSIARFQLSDSRRLFQTILPFPVIVIGWMSGMTAIGENLLSQGLTTIGGFFFPIQIVLIAAWLLPSVLPNVNNQQQQFEFLLTRPVSKRVVFRISAGMVFVGAILPLVLFWGLSHLDAPREVNRLELHSPPKYGLPSEVYEESFGKGCVITRVQEGNFSRIIIHVPNGKPALAFAALIVSLPLLGFFQWFLLLIYTKAKSPVWLIILGFTMIGFVFYSLNFAKESEHLFLYVHSNRISICITGILFFLLCHVASERRWDSFEATKQTLG